MWRGILLAIGKRPVRHFQVRRQPRRCRAFTIDPSGNILAGGGFTSIGGLSKTGFALLSGGGAGVAHPAWVSVDRRHHQGDGPRQPRGAPSSLEVLVLWAMDLPYCNNIARSRSHTPSIRLGVPRRLRVATWCSILAIMSTRGKFTAIGGQARNRLARLAASGSGAADGSRNPLTVRSPRWHWIIQTDRFVGGSFATIGGQARGEHRQDPVAGSGSAADTSWNPARPGIRYGPSLRRPWTAAATSTPAGISSQIRSPDAHQPRKLSTSGAGTVDAPGDPNPSLRWGAVITLKSEH